ncbi:1-deoxy-D-xylulose-5-phosphate synthase [Sporanaerobium hydrogeniformans]|uniref:1-deoxy-D-xylulose-5-phosphate synthase n=1 Tax=Sporanaerobium hydrogeniformans TaxID=3072179 RepID=A0AC61DII6_9FIRM|nr:1-deoxy-D-xylulose-5-phosphate synthase [Sporanaerobium hydrogeniformans]PHV72470.1 1-deoxy-D-xylulose-5-phosphate synthase [Sporanaerobium hydrogeniformans]
MLKLLKQIKGPENLKALKEEELIELAKEVRQFLVQSLAQTGGHLASNLGVVELTIALHYVFNSPQDKMIWDVGHQAYVHKLLTGRRKGFQSLRQFGGMSGFPKTKESAHDVFETGHSSTSISAALGMAVARDLKGEDHQVIAIIGDGALTGGMAFEALNNAGRGHTHLIVILNDNEMSISKNVGGMVKYLTKLRSSRDYLRAKEGVEDALNQVPVIGEHMVHTIKRTKGKFKSFLIENTLFEQLGVTYLGPIDGHSYEELLDILENAKGMKGPVLIHVKTKKGKGYRLAEENPSAFHGVSSFNIATGEISKKCEGKSFSSAFGEAMLQMASEREDVVAISAAMPEGTGLLEFSKAYPRRFFDVGIAEQHSITFAAGLAAQGIRPVAAIYSSFLQRAYDQILHDVCLQNLPVILGIDRAGLVGEDGATHQGLYDIAYLSSMPNMHILAPKVPEEVEGAIRYALHLNAPVAIRYPRGTATLEVAYHHDYKDVSLKTLKAGHTRAILACGKFVGLALEVSQLLEEQGESLAVIEAPCCYPLDKEGLLKIAQGYDYLFTLEDGILLGGFGEKVFSLLIQEGYTIKGHQFGYESGIVEHGDIAHLLEKEGLTPQKISVQIQRLCGKESK